MSISQQIRIWLWISQILPILCILRIIVIGVMALMLVILGIWKCLDFAVLCKFVSFNTCRGAPIQQPIMTHTHDYQSYLGKKYGGEITKKLESNYAEQKYPNMPNYDLTGCLNTFTVIFKINDPNRCPRLTKTCL
jgi:hypothetical protein